MADRALHVGIDGRELVGQPTGVGRYLASLLREWASGPAAAHRFTIFLPAPPPAALAALAGPLTWRVLPSGAAGTRWEQTTLTRAAAAAGLDVFFAPAYTAPLRLACPLVLTIHDLSYFAHPEWFSWREGIRRRWITRRAARRAARILAVSQTAAREIAVRLGVEPARVTVVPHGAPAVDRPAEARARERLVLYVGSLFERRHIPELIAAFATVAARVPDARLVLVGADRSRRRLDPRALAASHGVGDRVEWRAYVSDAELEDLYWKARAFAFLSSYEGFAMTPLEALAHDVPIVLLDTPVAREIYREAAAYVAPAPESIAAALTSVLTDEALHAASLARGRRLVASYSWHRAAQATLDALERAAVPA